MPANFRTARNERTSLYEIHAEGCRHLIAPHLEVLGPVYQGRTGKDVKAQFEQVNEGCLAKLGPCAKSTPSTTEGA